MERIKVFRKGIGFSQEEFAQKLGVSRQTVIKWENGVTQPSLQNLLKISEVFYIQPKTLFNEDIDIKSVIGEYYTNQEKNAKSDKLFVAKKVIWHTVLVLCSAYMACVLLCVGVTLIYLFAPIDNSEIHFELAVNLTPETIFYSVIFGILTILSLSVIIRFLVVKEKKKREKKDEEQRDDN